MKINGLLSFSMECIFGNNDITADEIIEKYPFNYEKDIRKSLSNDWKKIGNDIKKAMSIYSNNKK